MQSPGNCNDMTMPTSSNHHTDHHPDQYVQLQSELLLHKIAPYLERNDMNHLITTNKEIYERYQDERLSFSIPWPNNIQLRTQLVEEPPPTAMGVVTTMTLSPPATTLDGNKCGQQEWLACGYLDGTVKLWNCYTGNCHVVLGRHPTSIRQVIFLPQPSTEESSYTILSLSSTQLRKISNIAGSNSNNHDARSSSSSCSNTTTTTTTLISKLVQDLIRNFAYAQAISQDGQFIAFITTQFNAFEYNRQILIHSLVHDTIIRTIPIVGVCRKLTFSPIYQNNHNDNSSDKEDYYCHHYVAAIIDNVDGYGREALCVWDLNQPAVATTAAAASMTTTSTTTSSSPTTTTPTRPTRYQRNYPTVPEYDHDSSNTSRSSSNSQPWLPPLQPQDIFIPRCIVRSSGKFLSMAWCPSIPSSSSSSCEQRRQQPETAMSASSSSSSAVAGAASASTTNVPPFHLATGSENGWIQLWNLAPNKITVDGGIQTLQEPKDRNIDIFCTDGKKDPNDIMSLATSTDGTFLSVGRRDGSISLWEKTTTMTTTATVVAPNTPTTRRQLQPKDQPPPQQHLDGPSPPRASGSCVISLEDDDDSTNSVCGSSRGRQEMTYQLYQRVTVLLSPPTSLSSTLCLSSEQRVIKTTTMMISPQTPPAATATTVTATPTTGSSATTTTSSPTSQENHQQQQPQEDDDKNLFTYLMGGIPLSMIFTNQNRTIVVSDDTPCIRTVRV